MKACLDGLANAGNEAPARRIGRWMTSCEAVVPVCQDAFAAATPREYLDRCKKAACPGWKEGAPALCATEVATEERPLLQQWASFSAALVRREHGSSGSQLAVRLEGLAFDFRLLGDGRGDQALGAHGGSRLSLSDLGRKGAPATRGLAIPTLVQGKPTISSGFDPAEVERVIGQRYRTFRYCFERELLAHPRLAGRLIVSFQIGAGGSVLSTAIENSTVPGDDVGTCLQRIFKKLTFPDPGKNAPVRVQVPLRFENEPTK